jgi:hypothetical protein
LDGFEGLQGLWTGGGGAGIFVRTEFFFGKNQGKKFKKKSLPSPLSNNCCVVSRNGGGVNFS